MPAESRANIPSHPPHIQPVLSLLLQDEVAHGQLSGGAVHGGVLTTLCVSHTEGRQRQHNQPEVCLPSVQQLHPNAGEGGREGKGNEGGGRSKGMRGEKEEGGREDEIGQRESAREVGRRE